jgi:hypothetical protein
VIVLAEKPLNSDFWVRVAACNPKVPYGFHSGMLSGGHGSTSGGTRKQSTWFFVVSISHLPTITHLPTIVSVSLRQCTPCMPLKVAGEDGISSGIDAV